MVCTVVLPVSGFASAAGKPPEPPNIIMVFSDSHRADVTGCYGDPIARTPNLDRLAEQGCVFENHYCNSPLCGPSRLSFTSGKYASKVGVWNLWYGLPDDPEYPTLARLLNRQGYESFFRGHMDYPPDNSYGFTNLGKKGTGRVKNRMGSRRNPDDLKPLPGYTERLKETEQSQKTHDVAVTKTALDFLRDREAGDRPFFLLLGYAAPHYPFTVPEEYHSRYRGRIPMPKIPEGHLESQPLNYKHLRIAFNVEDVPEDVIRRNRELYYGLTEWFDGEVGKVMDALEGSPFADNTLVIYSSDHGENLGDHGLWWKNAMYDPSARVPLIVSWPGRWEGNQRRSGACSLVDVARTIVEVSGAAVPPDWDGDSMVPWLEDPAHPWKDRAVSEYYAHKVPSGYAMICEDGFKYVYHTPASPNHPAERELYNMKADPDEFENLAGRPEFADRIEQMHAALVEETGEEPDRTEQRCRTEHEEDRLKRKKKG